MPAMTRVKRTVFPLFVAWLLAVAGSACSADEPIVDRDITYRTVDGVPLQLDIARPAKAEGPLPLVVCIHGGGWHHGHRAFWGATTTDLAREGFVAATVSYRLAPQHKWPAQIEDVKAAVRFLRANAQKYGIDPKRVACLGDSAGGHLSLMLGLTDDDDFEAGENQDQPAKVQAVINYYGPTNMDTWKLDERGTATLAAAFQGKNLDQLIESWTGISDRNDPRLDKVSPASYLDSQDPPVLTFQGTADVLVPVAQARELDELARKAGVSHELVILEGANHGWGGELKVKTNRMALEFLKKQLQ
jgi:acetyl esterase/lipase